VTHSKGRVWTGVIRVAPHNGDHRVAVRAAISVAVPLLVLWALDRLDLSVYASFGAFAALYGRHDRYGDRLRMQVAAGATLVTSMLIGTALSALGTPSLLRVAVVALVAGGVTLLSAAMRWHPPGALFAVFAAGACAGLPADPGAFGAVLLVGGLSVAFSVAVTAAFAVARASSPLRRAPSGPGGTVVAWEMAATVFTAAFLAGTAGLLILSSHWYWATVGAVAAVSGAHTTARVIRGVQRLLGTLAGVVAAAGILALHLPPLATIAVAVVLQAAAEMFVGRNYGIAMVFVTPLALLMVELAVPTAPGALLHDRVIETIIGVAVGTLVAVVSAALRHRGRRPDVPR